LTVKLRGTLRGVAKGLLSLRKLELEPLDSMLRVTWLRVCERRWQLVAVRLVPTVTACELLDLAAVELMDASRISPRVSSCPSMRRTVAMLRPSRLATLALVNMAMNLTWQSWQGCRACR